MKRSIVPKDDYSDDTEDFFETNTESELKDINVYDDSEIDDDDVSMTQENTEYFKKCIYNFEDQISDEDEFSDGIYEEESDESDFVKKNERISKPVMTKYERVRILSDRVAQLVGGSKPLIKNAEHLPPLKIAEEELKHNLVPFKIRRPMPDGRKEMWSISELKH